MTQVDADRVRHLDGDTLQRWAARGSTALAEQALFAGGNFALNVTLAGILAPQDFGAFAFAFALYMIAQGVYNAFILEPATVMRTSLYDSHACAYCRAQLALHAALTVPLAAALCLAAGVLAAGNVNAAVGRALLGAGIAAPFILVLTLARRFLYILGRAPTALAGSALYMTTILLLLLAPATRALLSPLAGFLLLGVASAVASGFLLWRIGVFQPVDPEGSPRLRELVEERWTYGKWLLGAVCIEATVIPGLTLITTMILGLGAVGTLRAMQIFTVPLGHALGALTALALPVLARDYGQGRFGSLRNKMSLVVSAVAIAALGFELLLVALQRPLEHLVYGGKFADYAYLIPILGAAALLEALAILHAMLLSAVQRPHLYLTSLAITAPCALAAGFILTTLFGITGAAAALAVTSAISIATRRWLVRPWLSRRVALAS